MTYKLKEFGDALRQHIAQHLPNPFEDAARGRDPAPTRAEAHLDGDVSRGPASATASVAAVGLEPATATNSKRKRGRPRKGEKK